MMRELKAGKNRMKVKFERCCSPNPYDEGTESVPLTNQLCLAGGCSPNPYDEGTERRLLLAGGA